jgi:hypothetical protein
MSRIPAIRPLLRAIFATSFTKDQTTRLRALIVLRATAATNARDYIAKARRRAQV